MTTVTGSSPFRSLAIVGVLFFIIGFFTWINGPLITFVQLAFDLDEVNAFLVLMVFYLSYFFLALPAAAQAHGHEEGPGGQPVRHGGGCGDVRRVLDAALVSGRAVRPVRHRRRRALLQTAVNPYVEHPRPHRGAPHSESR